MVSVLPWLTPTGHRTLAKKRPCSDQVSGEEGMAAVRAENWVDTAIVCLLESGMISVRPGFASRLIHHQSGSPVSGDARLRISPKTDTRAKRVGKAAEDYVVCVP